MLPSPVLLISAGGSQATAVWESLEAHRWPVSPSPAGACAAIVVSEDSGFALTALQNLRASGLTFPVILLLNRATRALTHLFLNAGFAACASAEELIHQLELLPCTARSKGPPFIGQSRAIRELSQYVAQISETDCNVLIMGETGTGKEVVAEAIHATSPRHDKPFVCLNTAAIPDALVESELFGHERGAFTGAASAQTGKLVFANSGTVFFDEIGDVGLSIQAKLLRAIESRKVYRLGSNRPVDLDIRIVAATNQDLDQAMEEKRFRRDLYYRVNVVRLDLPPLRDRREDIPLLVAHFFAAFNRRWNRELTGLSRSSLDALVAYHWPGNVRELRNVVEALFASLSRGVCGEVDIPPQVMRQLAKGVSRPEPERDTILRALMATDWNRVRASEQLKCSRMTLYRKMHQHQLPLHGQKTQAS